MIHELRSEGLSISEIGRRLGIDRKTVRKYLQCDRNDVAAVTRQPKASKLDPYRQYLCERLRDYPQLTARRLLREIQQRGYEGRYTVVVDYVRQIRPLAEVDYEIRFETPPGRQAQVDFAHFQVEFLAEPGIRRRLYLFAMALGHSRYLWGRFCENQKLQTVLAMHMAGFEAFAGAPRQVLYDRMKTAVTGEDRDGRVIYNLTLQSLLQHYGAVPRACRPYRAKTKGKIERSFRYVREDFFVASRFETLEHLNECFARWLDEVANQRRHGSTGKIVVQAFEAEQSALQALPAARFQTLLALERKINREGLISYEGNRYSVPDGTGVRLVEVQVLALELRIVADGAIIARHAIAAAGKGQMVIDPSHRKMRRFRPAQMPAPEDTAPMAPRPLSFYDAVGHRLATQSASVQSS